MSLLHIGDLAEETMETRYRQLGGEVTVIHGQKGENVKPVVEFILSHRL